MFHPSIEEFRACAEPGRQIPIYREILADLETPVSAYMKISKGQDYGFLQESVEQTGTLGRHSFLGTNPSLIFRSKGNRVTIVRAGEEQSFNSDDPLGALRELMATYHPVDVKGLPSFHGGAVGYLSYDQVRSFERLPDENPDPLNLPDLYFIIAETLLIFDHLNNKMQIVSNVQVGNDVDAAYKEGVCNIEVIEKQLKAPLGPPAAKPRKSVENSEPVANVSRDYYCETVRKAKEYICAGDIFQVVLSQRFARKVTSSPLDLYRALRCINPSPYMLLMQFPEFALVGSSPEVMTQVKDGIGMVRPIAGTRPRGDSDEEDAAYEKDLLSDEKELAEHIMLVDLGRNDLGRVSKPGTVAPVPHKRMVIERYSHVMHIVSEVVGQLNSGFDAFDALSATFPMGTVSGAPKIRAMEIIDELETERRGPYSGGFGYIGFYGDMDTCILIRTMIVQDGVAYLQAGAGIVYDSVPETEYQECLHKAAALFKAIDFAERGLEA